MIYVAYWALGIFLYGLGAVVAWRVMTAAYGMDPDYPGPFIGSLLWPVTALGLFLPLVVVRAAESLWRRRRERVVVKPEPSGEGPFRRAESGP